MEIGCDAEGISSLLGSKRGMATVGPEEVKSSIMTIGAAGFEIRGRNGQRVYSNADQSVGTCKPEEEVALQANTGPDVRFRLDRGFR
jgi:hypothetical protein